ncbi:ElyC/SanA/YdcF family protein [Proteiniborus sp.]|uniref:SanA/YdcF family protein n=1 Tax=Proteiniborus sp. TaxID=2079015 RepID=UPI003328FFA7
MKNKAIKTKRKKLRIMLIALIVLSILALASILIINDYIKSSIKSKIITVADATSLNADCILVLGAGVWGDGRPSHMLEDRLLQGIELYENGASEKLLMSGDHGRKEYDEVNAMKKYAIDRGVPSEHIFMDHAGFSTYESLYRARDIFKANKIIIVTQKYHMYRALYIAEKLGLEAYGVASDPREYVGQESRELREILARVKDFFNCILKPEPTYLGDSIPISGDGNLTND